MFSLKQIQNGNYEIKQYNIDIIDNTIQRKYVSNFIAKNTDEACNHLFLNNISFSEITYAFHLIEEVGHNYVEFGFCNSITCSKFEGYAI